MLMIKGNMIYFIGHCRKDSLKSVVIAASEVPMLDRVYGDIPGRKNDGVSVLLMPGEKPRHPYPWKQYDSCPHCGSIGLWEQNDQVGHCLKCSTWIWREMGVPWNRDTMPLYCGRKSHSKTYNRARRTVTCSTPGCENTIRTRSYRADIYCHDCRLARKRANDAKQWERRKEKSRLAVTSDEGGRSGVVKTDGDYPNSQRKEAVG